jgi:hypothetical protein
MSYKDLWDHTIEDPSAPQVRDQPASEKANERRVE